MNHAPVQLSISTADPHPRKRISLLGTEISYVDAGVGDPIVFLHGNPTSSYLWRKVLPQLGGPARMLAPDLIGMGESGKPDVDYSFADHARYLDAWFDALGLGGSDGIVLVGHDWGGALGLDWARRHPGRVRGVAVLETILKPMTWAEFPAAARDRFRQLRTSGVGESMILERNLFVDEALPRTISTVLAAEDHDVYRRPYPTPESRRPLLAWPRSMPLDGEPADVVTRVRAYDEWLARTPEVPKLLLAFAGHPTLMIGPAEVEWCVASIAGLEIEHCGEAGHVAPEDRPDEIAAAISAWSDRHGLRDASRHSQSIAPGPSSAA